MTLSSNSSPYISILPMQPNDLWLQQEFEAADADGNGDINKTEFVSAAKDNVKLQVGQLPQ